MKKKALKPFKPTYTGHDIADIMVPTIKRTLANCKKWVSDKDVVEMLINDAHDYQKIQKFIAKGRLDLAGKKAWDIDTAARDEIPKRLYTMLSYWM